MKITVAPSEDQHSQKIKFYSVTVEHSDDSADLETVTEMVFQALHGWGYNEDHIQEAFNKFRR